jgi:hypothetical protein
MTDLERGRQKERARIDALERELSGDDLLTAIIEGWTLEQARLSLRPSGRRGSKPTSRGAA